MISFMSKSRLHLSSESMVKESFFFEDCCEFFHRWLVLAWVESDDITCRGVLFDYAFWAAQKKIIISAFSKQVISLDHLQSIIKEQNIFFHLKDVFLIEFEFDAAFNAFEDPIQKVLTQRPSAEFIGVKSFESMLRFLWENQFATMAENASAFERSPITRDHADAKYVLHEWLLAEWGMPIDEMFDLERLTETCQQLSRWEFFLVSVPLKLSWKNLSRLS